MRSSLNGNLRNVCYLVRMNKEMLLKIYTNSFKNQILLVVNSGMDRCRHIFYSAIFY